MSVSFMSMILVANPGMTFKVVTMLFSDADDDVVTMVEGGETVEMPL